MLHKSAKRARGQKRGKRQENAFLCLINGKKFISYAEFCA